ncbi:Predicted nuclease of restriction endonuclease-like (RecB) superfamily, DUF1016 family [Cnuella takakiae]|uniref:Predicted nuclease of restriction endonuclease-like (RecB) superfamily, DUF1016 family n=1 Tax=Cnuella takakiae TaxID=1302690 RepID=A0A1M4ZCY9_9BACT|nr:PDDEXK nuclease domain-containing protein [Cnuella takakiae]OLY94249.1 hypothetical protein BUE76_21950 [Cnuella takakiae]SHF15881.1 Predicted nuclease of restriction endonuclease-like (RecB) superfamily, DUF1016 family [Cnuella takakiae]
MNPAANNSLYHDIKTILQEARQSAYRAVNFAMVVAYWEIGQRIVEHDQGGSERAAYGTGLLKELAKQLTADFGKGFTVANLENFRKFYQAFPENSYAVRRNLNNEKSHAASDPPSKNSYALRPELSWTHYRLLMRVDNEAARRYYMAETIAQNWSSRALERQINSFYYDRIIATQNPRPLQEEAGQHTSVLAASPEDFIKDPYVLEFLNLPSETGFLEKDLEAAIIQKLQQFLLELGKGFSFVAQQKRISADGEHFFVDLVFYNYILKCFVLIDLKLGKLTHGDIGQMDFYVRWFEDNMKTASDNPTIGIILCSEKNETVVKYSVLKDSKQLFASKYKIYLPSEEELKKEVERELTHYKQTHHE